MSSSKSPLFSLRRRAGRQLAFQFVYERALNARTAAVGPGTCPQEPETAPSREEMDRFARRVELPWDDQPEAAEDSLQAELFDSAARSEIIEFACYLAAGVIGRRDELDGRIAGAAHHWSLQRMAPVDRAILRVGAFELLFGDTPPRVVVNEAVEMAKRFGGAESGAFVNGILDRLMHEKHGELEGE